MIPIVTYYDKEERHVKEEYTLNRNFKRAGKYISWHESRYIDKICDIAKKEGIYFDLDKPIKKRECFYKNGKLEGNFMEWNSHGVLITDYNYKRGRRHGRCYDLDVWGKGVTICSYKKGKLHGEYVSSGRGRIYNMYFINGLMEGHHVANNRGFINEKYFIHDIEHINISVKILLLEKLINRKKEKRVHKKLLKNINKVCRFPILVYDILLHYVDQPEKFNLWREINGS